MIICDQKYAFGYITCLFLNIVNCITSMTIFNKLILGKFFDIGPQMLSGQDDEKWRFLKDLFPRMSMCTWRQYGEGGAPKIINYLCMLNTNVIIEKIFVFLWFWLVFLLISSILNFLYHVLFMVSKNEVIRSQFLAFTTHTSIKNLQVRVDDGNREKEKQQRKTINKVVAI